MNFKWIKIENFKSFGEETVEMSLDFSGVKLLVGKNGTGKTSFFDALVWCVYGNTDLKADNVVNKFTKKNCKVEVCFESDNNEYVITRYRKHSVHGNNIYLFKNKENITPKGAREVQEKIIEIIGIDYRALVSSVILSSETYKQFLRETNSSRLAIFDSLFSLKEISLYSTATKIKIKNLQSSNSVLQNELSTLNGSSVSMLETLKKYRASFDAKKKELKISIRNIERDILDKETELKDLEKVDINKEKKKYSANEKVLQRREFLMEKLNELPGVENKKDDARKLKKVIASLTDDILEKEKIDIDEEIKFIDKYEKTRELVAKLENMLTIEKASYSSLQKERSKISKAIDDIKNSLLSIESKIQETLGKEDVCPECGSGIHKDVFLSIVQKHESLREKEKEKLDSLEKEIFSIDEKVFACQEKINRIENGIPEINKPSYSRDFLMNLSRNISQIKSDLDNNILRLNTLSSEIENIEEKTLGITNELDSLPEVDCKYSIDQLDRLSEDINECKSKLFSLKSKKELLEEQYNSPIDMKYVKDLADTIKEKRESIQLVSKQIEENENLIIYYQALESAFSNGEGGFKKYFIENSIDIFNEKINMYLPFFFKDDIIITFDKNLNETIMFKDMETEFNELSSGQKTRAELAVVFSLYMMVRALFGSGTNLLVFDEILDKNLDDDGVNSVVNILNNIAEESAIFVVSHKEEYKEKFPLSIKVKTDGNGFTKLEE